MTSDAKRRFDQAMLECSPPGAGATIGVAVSGGGDSTALLLLLAEWARAKRKELFAVTVDHGLRQAAATEAGQVARLAATLGISHDTLAWRGWTGEGNLQATARAARFSLIADWARQKGIDAVALGHSLDDQAETVLMRLLRGSGVDGLSGMTVRRKMHGIDWIRPLLGFRRAELRAFLTERGVGWCDDPSNEDQNFDRIRMRKALGELERIGLSAEGVAATADRMQRAGQALRVEAHRVALAISRITDLGEVEFDADALASVPEDIRNRLLAHALCWVGSATYRPRMAALQSALRSAQSGKRSVLAGCLVTPAKSGQLRIGREAAALAGLKSPVGELWDNRWRLVGPAACAPLEVRMLGDNGLNSCANWRETGFSRDSLLTSPSVWCGTELIAAPLAGRPDGWRAELVGGREHFLATVLSH